MTPEQGQALIRFVRRTAECALATGRTAVAPDFAAEVDFSGLFVTFHNHGKLRGCMGTLAATGPFADTLAQVTSSSLRDPRFVDDPLTFEELPEVDIEISILGPLWRVNTPEHLEVGRHGVVVSRGGRSGCFLPQVAAARGWTVAEFLSECCRLKAGLDPDAWRDPQTRIEAFEAEVIHERPLADLQPP